MLLPLVLYHANCWDGFCAAWVAKMALGEIQAIPVHYGQPAGSVKNREVYILDFCYPRQELMTMAEEAKSLLVLDHHQTALAELDAAMQAASFKYRFDNNASGGRIAWEHFGFIGGWEGQPAPWLVEYTEDRDLWQHKLPESETVNAALRSYPLEFHLWDQFNAFPQPPHTFLVEGGAIRRREQQIVHDHVRNARRENFDGTWTVPIVNATTLFSEIAGELAKGEAFAACYFDRQDGRRQWSLRSDPNGIDVSAIAVAHGGGGHPHAAGFETAIEG